MKQIRNSFHIIGGFSIMYFLAKIAGFFSSDYNGWANRVCVSIVLFVFATVIGILYEFIMNKLDNERNTDFKDALRTGYGGYIAGIFTLFTFDSVIFFITFILTILALISDIILYLNERNKNKRT